MKELWRIWRFKTCKSLVVGISIYRGLNFHRSFNIELFYYLHKHPPRTISFAIGLFGNAFEFIVKSWR